MVALVGRFEQFGNQAVSPVALALVIRPVPGGGHAIERDCGLFDGLDPPQTFALF